MSNNSNSNSKPPPAGASSTSSSAGGHEGLPVRAAAPWLLEDDEDEAIPSSSSGLPHQAAAAAPSLDDAVQGLLAAYSASKQHHQPPIMGNGMLGPPSYSKKRSFTDMMMMMQGAAASATSMMMPTPAEMLGLMGAGPPPPLPPPPPAAAGSPPVPGAHYPVDRGNNSPTKATTARPLPKPFDRAAWNQTLKHLPRCFAAPGIQETSYFRNKTHTVTRNSRRAYVAAALGRSAAAAAAASSSASSSTKTCLRRLLKELSALEDDLPEHPAIWLAFDEETPQFCRALITAPDCTPYAYGLFCFDIYVPDAYPAVSPKMQLLTTGGGSVRFSPNLYADGKVCLSLLGTWSGPKWDPTQSTLLQVLVSIQGLILGVEKPYYLEPGFGGWEGHVKLNPTASSNSAAAVPPAASPTANSEGANSSEKQSAAAVGDSTNNSADAGPLQPKTAKPYVPAHVQRHEDCIREGTIKYALLETLQAAISASNSQQANTTVTATTASASRYLQPFGEIILEHFYHHKDLLLYEVKGWVDMMAAASGPSISLFGPGSGHHPLSSGRPGPMRKNLCKLVTKLEATLLKLPGLLAKNGKGQKKQSPDDKIQALLSDPKADPAAVKAAVIASKQRIIEEAIQQGDYMKAGLVQCELKQVEKGPTNNSGPSSSNLHGSVELKIAIARQEIQTAASKSDFITAGKLQVFVKHLEKNMRRLQDLQRRMQEAASQLDYCRAGRFQEQYRILMQSADDSDLSGGGGIIGNSNTTTWTSGPGAAFPKAYYGGPNDDGYDDEYGDEFYDDYGEEY